MTIQHLYPTTRPALDLNFARQKRLDSRVTFTRGSTATYVGSDGLIKTAASGEARFDHDPVTGESLGLLVEESRTNLALYSGQLDQAYWNVVSGLSKTPNAAVAPDGTNTAIKLTPNSGATSNNFVLYRDFTGLSGSTTGSFYVKYAGHRYARIAGYILDLLSTTDGQYSVYVGNGWHRIYHTFTTSTVQFSLNVTAAVSGQTYTGNGVDGIYIWGAQFEAGAFPTSYIPTTTASVTRAADVASMTGTNFSSWYNSSAGTVFARFKSQYPDGEAHTIFEGQTGSTIRTVVFANINRALLQYGSSSVYSNNAASGYPTESDFSSVALFYTDDGTNSSFGGSFQGYPVVSGTGTGGLTSSLLRFAPFTGAGGSGQASSAHLSRFTYYPTRLSNDQLQALTL